MGADAWKQVAHEGMSPRGASTGGVNRLLVHSVSDDVGRGPYIVGASRLLAFVKEFALPFTSFEDRDAALADCLAWYCYQKDADLQVGKNIFRGSLYVMPDLVHRVPLAHRALKGWERFAITNERAAVPWPAVFAIAQRMKDQGHPESADIAELCADAYLREGDWKRLRPCDVVSSGVHGVALILGRGGRGESAKSGTNQSVRIDREGIATKVLMYRDRARRAGQKFLFSQSVQTFYNHWNQACKSLKLNFGPPHCLRHTGPSFDLLQGPDNRPYRSLKEVKTRGRWSLDKSVIRYAKSGFYLHGLELISDSVVLYGKRREKDVGPRPAVALN